MSQRQRVQLLPYWFMLPAVLVVAAVSCYPIIYAIRLSTYNTNFMRLTGFAGLKHYLTVLGTAGGWINITNSLVYVFGSLALLMPLSLLLAIFLNRPVRFQALFRTVIVLPWVVSQTIAGLLWKWVLNPDYGPLIPALEAVGLSLQDPLAYKSSAMISLILVNVWLAYPFAVVLILAALQTVPTELYEAASVDGAAGWVSFRRITLPLIQPTMLITTIMLTLLFFNMVTLILTLTGGGPFSGTEVLSLKAFKESFEFWRIGLGAAYSVVIFIFNLVFSLIYIRTMRTDLYAA